MIGRRVALLEQVTVASPAYLERTGVPDSLDALASHRAVNYISSATGRTLPLEFTIEDDVRAIELPASIAVTGVELYTQAALAGLGIVQVPRCRIADALADGRLRCLLTDHPPPMPMPMPMPMPVSVSVSVSVSVLYPHNRQLSSRVRVFADWISAIFHDASAEGQT